MTVKQMQYLLLYLGYSPGAADGVWGGKSQDACRKFQTDYGLTADGVCGTETQKKLIDAVCGSAVKVEKPSTTGSWWDDIKHFRREEFKCKCGGRYCNGYPAEMQEDVVRIADAAREHFGKPGHIVSGLRCQRWNAHEGGVGNSQHMYGEAIDLRIDGVDSETLRVFVSQQKNHRYSYRINATNVHFDIPARPR